MPYCAGKIVVRINNGMHTIASNQSMICLLCRFTLIAGTLLRYETFRLVLITQMEMQAGWVNRDNAAFRGKSLCFY